MTNEHNPIAVKVDRLRDSWLKALKENPEYDLARWLVYPDDMDLVNGLLKIECSPHGKLPDIFVVLFTPFLNYEGHSLKLITDWIEMYLFDKEANNKLNWDFEDIRKRSKKAINSEEGDLLLLEMLSTFKQALGADSPPLVLGLLTTGVSDFEQYNFWLQNLLSLGLPKGVKLMVFDHEGQNYFEDTCHKKEVRSMTIAPGNMDIKGAIQQIATQGNPADPQVQIRKLMFEMGEATGKGRKQKVLSLGGQLLKLGQKTGDPTTFASMHLIFAGFLMHFKENQRIEELLDQGIRIAKKGVKKDENCKPVLIQLYGYRAANYSLASKHEKAVQWFAKQAQIALDFELKPVAIGAYKTAIYLADRHSLKEEYLEIVDKGYELGNKMTEEEIGVTEYAFIALHYLKLETKENKERCGMLEKRMQSVFGQDWKTDLNKIVERDMDLSEDNSYGVNA